MQSSSVLRRFVAVFGASCLLAASACAETLIASWSTASILAGGEGDLAPNFIDADAGVGSLTRGAGFVYDGGQNARWTGRAVEISTSLAASLAVADYFTVTLAPEAGRTLAIERLAVGFLPGSTSNGINTAQWQYSIDGGAYVDFGSSIKALSANGTFFEVDGADFEVVSGSSVTFRMVAWAANATTSTGRWGVRDLVPNAALSFYGTVAAVPEPASTVALVGGAAVVLAGMRRRRAVRG